MTKPNIFSNFSSVNSLVKPNFLNQPETIPFSSKDVQADSATIVFKSGGESDPSTYHEYKFVIVKLRVGSPNFQATLFESFQEQGQPPIQLPERSISIKPGGSGHLFEFSRPATANLESWYFND